MSKHKIYSIIFTYIITSLLILYCHSFQVIEDTVARNDFIQIQCNGTYKSGMFASINAVCQQCYDQVIEKENYNKCR